MCRIVNNWYWIDLWGKDRVKHQCLYMRPPPWSRQTLLGGFAYRPWTSLATSSAASGFQQKTVQVSCSASGIALVEVHLASILCLVKVRVFMFLAPCPFHSDLHPLWLWYIFQIWLRA